MGMTYGIGDMVAFRLGKARLIGEVCIRDRDLWGDGSDGYDIMVCSDLYRFGRDRSGCLFKHIPETAVERRMGRAVPLREGDPVHCVWRDGGVLEERIGSIAELGPAHAVLELRDGSTMRADLPEHGLDRLRTVWEDDGGSVHCLVGFSGRLAWDGGAGAWTAEDAQGAVPVDVWPESAALSAGDDLLALVGGEQVATELVRGADGSWSLAGLPGVGLEGLPVIGPYLASRTAAGGLELWRCWYGNWWAAKEEMRGKRPGLFGKGDQA